MTHDEAFALMMDALDGVLTAGNRIRLDDHLVACPECRAEWDSLQVVDSLLAGATMVPAPDGFGQRLEARLAVPSWRRAFGALFALGLGSLLILVLVAVPASIALLAVWTAYNDPQRFADMVVWLNQLARVSGALLGSLLTTTRLVVAEIAANPLALLWSLAAGVAVALWGHLTRQALAAQANHH